MSTASNRELVRRYYEDVVNRGDVARLSAFIAPDYVEVYNNVRHPVGLAGAAEHLLGVRRVWPDLHLTVERQIAEGEWVATQVTARGTHEGVFMGMQPTGRPMEMSGVNLDRVVGGRIVEHGGAANMLEPLLDAGALTITRPAEA